jgi:hypothetical protein
VFGSSSLPVKTRLPSTVPSDAFQRGAVGHFERWQVGLAHEPADDRHGFGRIGHDVGLLVAQHLEAVLDRA